MAVSKIITSSITDNVTIAGTSHIGIPSGTTAQRSGSPSAGNTRFNTTTGFLEFYNGTEWVTTNLIPGINSITGNIYVGVSTTLTLSVSNASDTIDVKYYESGTLISTDSGVTVTNGSATSTVPSAVYGQTAGDTILIQVFNVDGTPSSNSIEKTVATAPSGGTITTTGNYRVHTFTTSGTFTNTINNLSVDYFAVASGGGGGSLGGGGGAGGVLSGTTTPSQTGHSIVINGPGVGGGSSTAGTDGGDTTLFGLTAVGGGGGGSHDGGSTSISGRSGGSGGGGSDNNNGYGPGSGTSGQGYSGGNGSPVFTDSLRGGGGGGGASERGRHYNEDRDGRKGSGGDGVSNDWLGTTYYFAGGGGRGVYGNGAPNTAGDGGLGGGGGGSSATSGGAAGRGGTGYNNGADGASHATGGVAGGSGGTNSGGGGGCGGYPNAGGNGGKGIVIIRYQLP